MTVSIARNIKKQRIFIDKHGNKITREQMYNPVGKKLGAGNGANRSKKG